MTEFLTTAGISNRLEQIITGSRKYLTLISPYIQIPPILLERLHEAKARGVVITVVCRENLRTEYRLQLQSLGGIRLKFMLNLHAKCYQNETGILISSMNFYHFSEKTNREMGIYLAAGTPAHDAAVEEITSIVSAAREWEGAKKPNGDTSSPSRAGGVRTMFDRRPPSTHQPSSGRGFCVRCRRSVLFGVERPFCIDCYHSWAEYGNEEYAEAYCHDCGLPEETSMRRPLCRSCWRKDANVF